MDILELAGLRIIQIAAQPFKKDTKCQLQILPRLLTSHNLNGSSSKVLAFDLRAGGEIPSETMRGNLGGVSDSKRSDLSKWN